MAYKNSDKQSAAFQPRPFDTSTLRPRNDFVVVRKCEEGQTPSGIALPDDNAEGVTYWVEVLGPQVEDLAVGERVEMMGAIGEDVAYVPRSGKKVLITKQANVLLAYRESAVA